MTTLISVNNGLASPALTRVVLWTDWGVPTLAFDIYLEGFDVQSMNLRSLLAGTIPSTGESADLSAYALCDRLGPTHRNPALTPSESEQLIAYHRGASGPLDSRCAGEPRFDQIARGYVTADVVGECSGVEGFQPAFTPANTDYPYFAEGGSGSGIALTNNVLWGDIVYVDFENNSAQGSAAIAIWADPARFSGTNIFTFYGRFSGWDGRDERVPLPYRWDQRFLNGGPFAGGADLIVWRDPGSAAASPVVCGTHPSWWPLESTSGVMNEQAGMYTDLAPGIFDCATQRVDVSSLAIPFSFGWIQVDSGSGQSWVQPTLTAGGRYSAAFNGVPVEFLCDKSPVP